MARVKWPDNTTFVIAWFQGLENGCGREHVADQLYLTDEQVAHRAQYLRSRGVKLPKLNNGGVAGRKRLDINVVELNKIIEEITQRVMVK